MSKLSGHSLNKHREGKRRKLNLGEGYFLINKIFSVIHARVCLSGGDSIKNMGIILIGTHFCKGHIEGNCQIYLSLLKSQVVTPGFSKEILPSNKCDISECEHFVLLC